MTDQDHSRRTFLTRVGLGCVAATGLASIGATGRYLFPAVLYEPSMKSKIGRPSSFADGSITFLSESKIFVYKSPQGIYAISAICTHLGCVVTQTETGFSCPCHGSVFDGDGVVTRGPAPRGLPWLDVSMTPGGQLVVDRSRQVPPGTSLKV